MKPGRGTRAALRTTLFLLAATGCEGTEVGNPVEQLELALTARSSAENVTLEGPAEAADSGADAGSSAGTAVLAVDTMWVSLGGVRFSLDDDCSSDRDTRATVAGPVVAELTEAPTVLSAELPDADYCGLRVSLERATDEDPLTPDELVGYSVMLEGRRGDGVRFRIRSRDKTDLVLRSKGEPFRLEGNESPMFLAFDAAAWLEGVDVDSATVNDEGAIAIVPSQNAELLRVFQTNLRRSLSLFKDADENGELDGDEMDDPLAM